MPFIIEECILRSLNAAQSSEKKALHSLANMTLTHQSLSEIYLVYLDSTG